MEGSSKSAGQQCHVRSISLPSRLHPTCIKVETELNKLKTTVSTSSPVSSDTIASGLVGLADLYNCVEELIQSPHTQKALLRHQNGVVVENALEGSIGLLDLCGTLKDLLSLMKENLQDLQSALRRKGGNSSIESYISAYFCSRKQAKRIIGKSLRALEVQMKNKTGVFLPLDTDQHLSMVVRVLREVSAITINVIRSLLLFLSVSCSRAKPSSRWSLISNLMMKSSTSCERNHAFVNEVESVDLALHSLHSKVDVQLAHTRLQKLDANIECIEAGLDCLFRRLIHSRFSLLNILAS